MGLQRFPYKDYRGGVNLRDGPFALESDETQDARNVQLTLRGSLKQRQGKAQFDASGFPVDGRADHLRNWYVGATRLLIASIAGDVFSSTTAGALTSRFDGTAGTVWDFESGLDGAGDPFLWAMNGTDDPQKWDGATASMVDWVNAPPNGTMLRLWHNKMVISGVPGFPQRLFFSDIGDPELPAAAYGLNWVDIKSTEDDLDPVTWIDLCGDYLLSFKRRSVWRVFDPITFANERIGTPGCEARFQSAELGGRCYFLARDGVYSTDGENIRLESDLITPFFTGETNAVGNLNMASIDKSRLAAARDRRLFVAVPAGSSSTNNVLWEHVPELRRRREDGEESAPWMPHDIPCSSICSFRPTNTDVVLAGAGDDDRIHQIFTSLNDDGAAISAFYIGSWKALFPEEPFERVRRVNVLMNGHILLETFRDMNLDVVKFAKILETEEDLDPEWDGGVWDGGIWDPINSTQLLSGRPEMRGQYHAVKFSNDELDKSFIIYSTELVIRGGKEH